MKRLAAALEEAKRGRSRTGKERAIGAALASIVASEDPEDVKEIALATAARIAAGRALGAADGRPAGVGWSLLTELVIAHTGYDAEIVRGCARLCGELGEAFGLLVAGVPGAYDRPGIPLQDVNALFAAIAESGSRVAKRARLDAAFARATPLETKYLSKVLLGGLRVGAQAGVLEGAIARAFDADVEEVRRAAALVTDPGELAVLAWRRRLSSAHMVLGRPVSYMLATPMENLAAPIDPALFVAEDKIDGVRAQIHKIGGEVKIFARGTGDVTRTFPDVEDAFRFSKGSFALDGELCATGEGGRPRPFQALQARLGRVLPTAALIADTPVTFAAFDLLHDGEVDLLSLPWTERRARLEQFAEERGPAASFVVNPDAPAVDLDAKFEAARARGHEGLVLKRTDALYEAGRRGQSWIKIKRALATLDVVVTAAQEGTGRRAGTLSDLTFGVWTGDDPPALVNVGKAYSGLTDVEIQTMTRQLEKITIQRHGGTRLVRPEIVLEVAFDGIQRSTRHKSGFALRFPRIARIREDKRAEDADRLEAVDALFRAQLESGHREEAKPPEPRPARADRRKTKNAAQLDLFGEPLPPPNAPKRR